MAPAQPRGLELPEVPWRHWAPEVALHRAERLLSSSLLRSDLAILGFRSLRHARVRQRVNCELNSPDSRLCTANLRATFPRGEAASRHFPSNSETREGKVRFVRLAAESVWRGHAGSGCLLSCSVERMVTFHQPGLLPY